MADEIKITKKNYSKGNDGHRVLSIRIKEATLKKLDELAESTNRSRNEIINILLEKSIEIVKIEEWKDI